MRSIIKKRPLIASQNKKLPGQLPTPSNEEFLLRICLQIAFRRHQPSTHVKATTRVSNVIMQAQNCQKPPSLDICFQSGLSLAPSLFLQKCFRVSSCGYSYRCFLVRQSFPSHCLLLALIFWFLWVRVFLNLRTSTFSEGGNLEC